MLTLTFTKPSTATPLTGSQYDGPPPPGVPILMFLLSSPTGSSVMSSALSSPIPALKSRYKTVVGYLSAVPFDETPVKATGSPEPVTVFEPASAASTVAVLVPGAKS